MHRVFWSINYKTLVSLLISLLFQHVPCCGSLLPIFNVRVSVTFHLTCVHITFSSVWVAVWPPFWK